MSIVRCRQFYNNLRKIICFYGVIGIGAIGLLSCSLAPKYQQPLLPIANTYPDSARISAMTTKSPVSSNASNTSWSEYFAYPYLQNLISKALENNRDLLVAALRVEEVRAAYQIEGSNQFPVINVGLNANHSLTPGELNITRKPLITTQYQVGLGLVSWELDFWLRIHDLKKAALENFFATDTTQRAAKISLIAQVADSYLTLRELDERIFLAQQAVANHKKTLHIFSKRFKVGAISQLDLSQVETLLTQAQILSAQLEQARAIQIHALTFLVGSNFDPPPKRAHFADNAMFHELRVGLPSELLVARPDIVAAEHQLKAAGANIGAARAAFFPHIALVGSFGSASTELGGLFEPGSSAWSFSPNVNIPLFAAGRHRAMLNLAEVRRNIAVANYEKTIQTAFREVSDTLAARYWLSKQVQIQQKMLAAEHTRARLTKLRYENGAAPYLEVLDAQRELLAVQQQIVQTRRAVLANHVRLYEVLGGGSQTDITPSPS